MQLDACPVEEDLEVVGVTVPPDARLPVREMGLREGAVVRVTHRAPFGARVVAVGGSRIAVDAATAVAIEIRARR